MFSAIKFAIMLTKEELENYLAELKRYAESGDPECAHAYADVGMFACKDEETALYVSSQFGDLVFQAIYGHSVNYYWN